LGAVLVITRAFALRGYVASGLDRSEEMIRFVRQGAKKEGAAVERIDGEIAISGCRLRSTSPVACSTRSMACTRSTIPSGASKRWPGASYPRAFASSARAMNGIPA
jgi:hypothetical protein